MRQRGQEVPGSLPQFIGERGEGAGGGEGTDREESGEREGHRVKANQKEGK
jgi:hypothetical protein